MKGILPLVLLIGLLAFCVGCMDEAPAELSIIAKLNGKPQPVTCQMFNDKGKQISEMSTDFNGIGYFRAVPRGTYTIKFCDNQYTYYPAVKTVTLQPDDSQPMNVELSSPTGEAAADGTAPSS